MLCLYFHWDFDVFLRIILYTLRLQTFACYIYCNYFSGYEQFHFIQSTVSCSAILHFCLVKSTDAPAHHHHCASFIPLLLRKHWAKEESFFFGVRACKAGPSFFSLWIHRSSKRHTKLTHMPPPEVSMAAYALEEPMLPYKPCLWVGSCLCSRRVLTRIVETKRHFHPLKTWIGASLSHCPHHRRSWERPWPQSSGLCIPQCDLCLCLMLDRITQEGSSEAGWPKIQQMSFRVEGQPIRLWSCAPWPEVEDVQGAIGCSNPE